MLIPPLTLVYSPYSIQRNANRWSMTTNVWWQLCAMEMLATSHASIHGQSIIMYKKDCHRIVIQWCESKARTSYNKTILAYSKSYESMTFRRKTTWPRRKNDSQLFIVVNQTIFKKLSKYGITAGKGKRFSFITCCK